MKNLNVVQKTVEVFKTLTLIGVVVNLIWAVLSLIGTGVWCGQVEIRDLLGVNITEELIQEMDMGGYHVTLVALLSDFVFAITDAILFLFAHLYLKAELVDGTPFTERGAKKVRNFGVKMIVLPLVAVIITAVIYEIFGVAQPENIDNGTALVFGVCLILLSLIFRYGAELEAKANGKEQDK